MNQPCILHVNPTIHLLEIPLTNAIAPSTNCYLITDGDESLIIDPGAPQQESFDALVSHLDVLGIDRTRASFALTHFHPDHAGLLDRIAPPSSNVYVGATELRRARPEHARIRSQELARRLFAENVSEDAVDVFLRMITRSVGFDLAAHDLRTVHEGDTIAVGRFVLDVLELPGHTAGHLAFYERVSRTLFCGDHVLGIISPCLEVPFGGQDILQRYFDSLDRTLDVPLERLAWGHGVLRQDFLERVRWLAHHHRQRVEEARAVIENNPDRTGIDIVRSLHWSVPFDSWEDIPPIQRSTIIAGGLAVVDHLVDRGIAEQHRAPDGKNRYRICTNARFACLSAKSRRMPSKPASGVWYDDRTGWADGRED